jgi:RNA polymerase sigma factor for flagellar operon FliA
MSKRGDLTRRADRADRGTSVGGPKEEPRGADPPEVLARVKDGLSLVAIAARQMRRNFGPFMEIEDLSSHGQEALLAAARTFDPERQIPFRRWAMLRVRGAMIDAARQRGSLPKRVYRKIRAIEAADAIHDAAAEEQAAAPETTSAAQADLRLTDQLGTAAMAMALSFLRMKSSDALEVSDPDHSPESNVGQAELLTKVKAAILELPEQERILLDRHYFRDATLEEAAAELGLSKSWASRLHFRAIESVARILRRSGTTG